MKILCFDIGGTFIKYAVCNENFQLSDKKKVPTNAKEGGQVIIKRIIEIIESRVLFKILLFFSIFPNIPFFQGIKFD